MRAATVPIGHSPARGHAPGADWADPPEEPTSQVERELQRLADTLAALLAREGDDPPVWASAVFARRVAAARSVMARVAEPERLAAGLDRPRRAATTGVTRFQADAQRLAGDAITIAITIRWLEVRQRTSLPSWPEVVRRRSLSPRRTEPAADTGLWFG